MKDSNISELKDSIDVLKNQFDSIQDQLALVLHKNDSILLINKDLNVRGDYFSDILNLQMDWFAIIFTATFGLLGLLYWFGLFKYFKNKFQKIESDKEAIELRISSLEASLNEKINKNDSSIREFYNEKQKGVEQNILNLSNKVDESVKTSAEELKTLIINQNKEFDETKKNLIKKIVFTDFNSHRAMFFSNWDNKSFAIALTWAIPTLRLIVVNGADADTDSWLDIVKRCLEEIKLKSEIDKSYEWLNDELSEIKSHIEDEKKALVDELIHKFNQIYYSNDPADPNEKDT